MYIMLLRADWDVKEQTKRGLQCRHILYTLILPEFIYDPNVVCFFYHMHRKIKRSLSGCHSSYEI